MLSISPRCCHSWPIVWGHSFNRSNIVTTSAPFQVKPVNFSHDAARRLAKKHGLVVISVCHASLANGVPSQDGYGNYVQARTVYIGHPGTIEKRCAFARCYSTIYQTVEPGIAEALSVIAGHLMYFDSFASRAEYETYHNTPYRLLPHQQTQLADAWHEHSGTAQRAIACLPAEIIAWLRSTY